MQLTSPAFLLLFLPLSLLLILPVPKRHRSKALAAVSVVWYALVNYRAPAGVLAVLLLVLFECALLLPAPCIFPRIRLFFGTVLPLSLLVAARLACEYGSADFRYPFGLTFVALAAVSATVDRVKGKCPLPRSIFDTVVYLLFFPWLFFGPLRRFETFGKLMEDASPSVSRLSAGVHLYMSGTIKYLALAAVLFRALEQLVSYTDGLHFLTALLMPLLAFCSFFLMLSGCSDISRGLSHMYGFSYPADLPVGFMNRRPCLMAFGAYYALYAYLTHYLLAPITRRLHGACGRVIALAVLLLGYGLFFRTRPEALLFLLPLFFLLLPMALFPTRKRPVRPVSRLLIWLCGALCLSPFLISASLNEPLSLLTLLSSLHGSEGLHHLHYVPVAIMNARYLLIALVPALALLPLSRCRKWLEHRLSGGLLTALHYTELLLLFGAFAVTLMYFLPQFPTYTALPFPNFYL